MKLRWVTAFAVMALLVLLGAPASAHVLIDAVEPVEDGAVRVTFSFDHGCDGAPTDEIVVSTPEGTDVVGDLTQPDGWIGEVTESSIRWTGPAIADGDPGTFTAVMRLTGRVGETLLFPTDQFCEGGGTYTWDDPADDAEEPAPRVVGTAATLDEIVGADTGPSGAGSTAVAVAVLLSAVIGATALRIGSDRLRRA
ncbi:hypothetical protein BHE97_02870 [Aeromicrobium sp. PE09-221]|uniref:DUF1775 domain-containing protein n=1 Tax=Aeromicrobium sp. PE09-221 TaxID=1898043 RepID=UPI000B3E673D|nr:DUF1775 domain-containing protein [Aeromicrobium sp. PE09-221]OUZ12148.1 hypothetical protein BHE97_02870 [Aeromicrobium sp. PE09-221]